jgi:hypothetical protein
LDRDLMDSGIGKEFPYQFPNPSACSEFRDAPGVDQRQRSAHRILGSRIQVGLTDGASFQRGTMGRQ